jgi:hypothetical protein
MQIPVRWRNRNLPGTVGWECLNVSAIAREIGWHNEKLGEILSGRREYTRLVDVLRIADYLDLDNFRPYLPDRSRSTPRHPAPRAQAGTRSPALGGLRGPAREARQAGRRAGPAHQCDLTPDRPPGLGHPAFSRQKPAGAIASPGWTEPKTETLAIGTPCRERNCEWQRDEWGATRRHSGRWRWSG